MDRLARFLLPAGVILVTGGAGACSEIYPQPLAEATPPLRFDARPLNATCLAPPHPLGRVRLEPAFTGFTKPLDMVDRPDLGLIYVAEVDGRIKVIDRATKQVTTALDLNGKIPTNGVFPFTLGLAIHPKQPYAYVVVDRGSDETTLKDLPFRAEILRFTLTNGGRTLDFDSRKLILRVDAPFAGHPPGTLLFGPDGFLYIGVGDGVRQVDRFTTSSLLGSIVRIDVDGGDPYAVPADNPYAAGGGRPEIYAGGFRNPWRFSFDRATGDLWGGDVGEARYEEIDKIERGKNYGWPTLEGNACNRPMEGCDRTGLTPPLFVYDHTEGAAITGGYVYRGKAMPDLVGKYIYADVVVGQIFMVDPAKLSPGGEGTSTILNPGSPKQIVSFAQDAEGELYVMSYDEGILYKLVPGDPDARPVFPERLSQTGCVDPADPTKLVPGLVPYGVNTELWSDGASKRRFVGIPDGTTIHVEDDGHLELPDGSVVVKEFSIDGKRIETRLLRRSAGGVWSGATYEWNDAGTEATAVLGKAKEKKLPNGQSWAFPSPLQCFRCHTSAAKITLGLETQQLNGDFAYTTGQSTNQLATLSSIGYLDRPVDPTLSPRLPSFTGTATVDERARAYLHVNCSICHRENGLTGAPMDFRYGLPLSAIHGCNTSGVVPGAQILSPGDPERSSIYVWMAARIMPPLTALKVNEAGLAAVKEWIATQKTCE